jgi:hypothetical protein
MASGSCRNLAANTEGGENDEPFGKSFDKSFLLCNRLDRIGPAEQFNRYDSKKDDRENKNHVGSYLYAFFLFSMFFSQRLVRNVVVGSLLIFNHQLEIRPELAPWRVPKEEKMTKKVYFGFALADSMFAGDCSILRTSLSVQEVKSIIEEGVEPCLNPSHLASIDAMRSRFGIGVPIPETPPKVLLGSGDSIVVMGVRGLPRLTDRHEYTNEEVASATFSFNLYTVL